MGRVSHRLPVLLPWERGAIARRAGESIEACPHESGTRAAIAWRSGWRYEDERPGNELPAERQRGETTA